MNSIEKLAELFEKFPGVGKRQAKRFVYSLLRRNNNYSQDLMNSIADLKKDIRLCVESFQYFYSDSNDELSPIARSEMRDRSIVMIVEKDSDLENIENLGIYNGLYFVLGGSIPVLSKTPDNFIRINELKNIIQKKIKDEELKEIIIGLSVNPQGEYTLQYLQENLKEFENIKISVLGRGLSTGTELEYSDKETFGNALQGRI